MTKSHPTNVWGGSWEMKCHCDLRCFTMPCPVHLPKEYVHAAEIKQAKAKTDYKKWLAENPQYAGRNARIYTETQVAKT